MSGAHGRSRTPVQRARSTSPFKASTTFNPSLPGHNQRFQQYRENLKALEKSKHDKELSKQKDAYERELRNLNTNTKNRLSYMRHSIQ